MYAYRSDYVLCFTSEYWVAAPGPAPDEHVAGVGRIRIEDQTA